MRGGALDPAALSSTRNTVPPNPQSFNVSLFGRPYAFTVHRSTSTLFIDPFPERPHFTIIAFSVSSRASLHNARFYWRKQLSLHYSDLEHNMPVMLLGLKRDERTEDRDEEGQYECVMPQEGLQAAQEMRCDRYAECSAQTGELMWPVLEDITRTAANTTTEKGGLSEQGCVIM
jgi:Ras homolog gene family, member A